jgi:hypothetical protein
MAHFALINNDNIVETVIVVPNEYEENGKEYLNSLGLNGNWIQTSYNHSIRKNYAGIGYKYNQDLDAFIPPKPFNSWILNEESCLWEPPVEYPNDDNMYMWNEETTSWEVINNDN